MIRGASLVCLARVGKDAASVLTERRLRPRDYVLLIAELITFMTEKKLSAHPCLSRRK